MAEAGVVKFYIHVGYVKSQPTDDKRPIKEASWGSRDRFKFWEISGDVLEMVQDKHIMAIEN